MCKRKPIRLKMNSVQRIVMHLALLTAVVLGDTYAEGTAEHRSDPAEALSPDYESDRKDSRGLRMDYDQWKPLGRGDPLKNDPTYDYVPPVLERVHYWLDSPLNKQDTPQEKKSEILVLGVSSKKPSTPPQAVENRRDNFGTFLKFIDGPKFFQNNLNSFSGPNSGQRLPQTLNPPLHKGKFEEIQRVPYTVLVPPPIPLFQAEMQFVTNEELTSTTPHTSPIYTPMTTTDASTTVQGSNLVYHLSSFDPKHDWKTYNGLSNTQNNTEEHLKNHIKFQEAESNIDKISFKESPSKTSSIRNKRPIVFPTEKGKIVFEHHSTITNPANYVTNTPNNVLFTQGPIIQPISKYPSTRPTHNNRYTSDPQLAETSNHILIHKDVVSHDRYVNSGKLQTNYLDHDGGILKLNKTNLVTEPTRTTNKNISSTGNFYTTSTYPSSTYFKQPIDNVPISAVNNLMTINNASPFHRRPHPIRDYSAFSMQQMQPPPHPLTTESYQYITRKPSGFIHSIFKAETSSQNEITDSLTTATSTAPTPTTTVGTSLTTDPLFKHYKQPTEPLKGPMYLIIQGHSKVKTYGPTSKNVVNDLTMAENNEIPQSEKYPVKHLHNLKEMLEVNERELEQLSKSRSKNSRTLKDLVDDGIGKYDIKETDLAVGFEVSDSESVPVEQYHKGTVENDETGILQLRKLKKFAKVREKRQVEEFLPVVEDTVETFIYDYLKQQSEGSGVGAVIASAITNDSSENESDNEISQDDEDDEDYDDIL